jgi:hypothetical protein
LRRPVKLLRPCAVNQLSTSITSPALHGKRKERIEVKKTRYLSTSVSQLIAKSFPMAIAENLVS